ncbi:MAG: hypothetical protein AAF683_03080 [Pseudomonadota bacterium]
MLLFFAAAFVLSMAFCRLMIAFAPKDAPDGERKTQPVAVPTSGGLAIAGAAALIYLSELIIIPAATSVDSLRTIADVHIRFLVTSGELPHIILAIFVLFVGAVDDARAIATRYKLLVLSTACVLVALTGLTAEKVFIPFADSTIPLPVAVSVIGSAIWLFLMMNATNFMDGSNGLALGCIAIMLAYMSLSFFGAASADLSPETVTVWNGLNFVIFLIVGAIGGFLVWNIQGLLYAGDAGALFAGTVFASFSLLSAMNGNIWFVATLGLPLLVDAVATLIWRATKGKRLTEPHRDHAYQLLIKDGWSHLQTALLWWTLTAICGLVSVTALQMGPTSNFIGFVAMLCSLLLLWIMQRAQWNHAQKQKAPVDLSTANN